ncbi:MAG: hypothetical protein Fur0037_13760 [Planctomycetota bacterium]
MKHRGPRRVYLGEFNLLMNGSTYLPLVSGLLRANAERSVIVRDHFEFAPFLFHGDRLDRLAGRFERPAVAAFSMMMWNANLSSRVAQRVKELHPDCLIVVGGANVPHDARAFLERNRWVDVAVRGEGELTFTRILERAAAADRCARADLEGIPGTWWRTSGGEILHCPDEQPFHKDLDDYASPYLEGLYEDVLAANPGLEFQAIIETNRGCPFRCTFCYWGKGGLSRKYRFHGLDRVKAEIDWMAEHRIRYVFNADSNFGIHRRDREIAEHIAASKQRTGYPEKFRTCYGKNTDEKIFGIGKLFHENALEKGITISYQSVSDVVQRNIHRENIRLDSAGELQRRFNDQGVPVYTELILGLPGETYQSFVEGVDRILRSGIQNQLFIYICQIFPNTDLDAAEYRARFGIETRTIDLTEIHGMVRDPGWIREQEEIVVATHAMPLDAWRRALVFAWVTMTMHSLKLGFFAMAWMVERFGIAHSDFLRFLAEERFDAMDHPRIHAAIATFHRKIDKLLLGRGRGCVLPGYGDIYWDEEEACFLRLSRNFDAFYDELRDLMIDFLEERKIEFDLDELDEVVRYQSLRIPRPAGRIRIAARFERNLPSWFERLFSTEPIPLAMEPKTVEFVQPDFENDLPRFARESILWGRKSGTMLTRVTASEAGKESGVAGPVR